ncbi:Na+/H+-dicarboxylate symporter [Caldanaerovirga acetigignens]|uniref:Na+/H+-dicarboxylate symporter n=1 Tax=Caldanaerovirga acetigignens TaxID=447595 RepID=A0A1M7I5K5_9FIRM|nr:dicarboxylate/amino acid:cation symporter [Caldanaerovirga acetigignens]SHM36082.1 Na+/H+-dicarboxylate symporter [Caldanaerovirga acetigignens]
MGVERTLKLGKRPLYSLIAVIIGTIVGWVVGPNVSALKPFGDVLIALLKFIVGPLIFVSIATAVTTVQSFKRLGKIFAGFIVYWFILGLIAAIVGYTIANMIKPGMGVQLGAKEIELAKVSAAQVLLSFIPSNPIKAFLELNTMQIIIMALLTGFAVAFLGNIAPEEYNFLKKMFESLQALIYKIVDIILWYAPVGVFALMANLVGTVGTIGLASLGKMVFTQWVAYLAILLVIHPLFMLLFLKVNPIIFWKKVYPAMLTAFVTQSSSATLPITLRVTKTLGVPSDAADVIIPLAATINMQAVAAEMPIYAVWVAQMNGAHLTVAHIAVALMMGVFGAAACAGVPGGGIMIAALTLQTLGLPLDPVGWIAGIYVVIDMFNTMLNVTGDPLGVMAVSKFVLKEFDRQKFQAPSE